MGGTLDMSFGSPDTYSLLQGDVTPTDYSDPNATLINATFDGGSTAGSVDSIISTPGLPVTAPDGAPSSVASDVYTNPFAGVGTFAGYAPVTQTPTDVGSDTMVVNTQPITGATLGSNPTAPSINSASQVLGLFGQATAAASRVAVAASGGPTTLSGVLGSLGTSVQRIVSGQTVTAAPTTSTGTILLYLALGVLVLVLLLHFFGSQGG